MPQIRTTGREPSASPEKDAFHALVEALPDALILIGDRRVVYANRAMHSLLHEPPGGRLQGRPVAEILHSEAKALLTSIDSIAAGESIENRLEISWRRHGSAPVVTDCAVGRVALESGSVVQIVARDITDRRATDDTLRRVGISMATKLFEGRADLRETNARLGTEIGLRERAESDRDAVLVRLAFANEQERRRLSRELHDEVGQHLTSLLLGLQGIIDVAGIGSEVTSRAKELQVLAQRLGGDLHDVAVRLRPKALDDFGVEAALTSYAKDWSRQSGIAVELQTTGRKARLPDAVETALYRIAQEALTNAARHSRATRVSLVLNTDDATCRLTIEDDGAGFDVGAMRLPGGEPDGLGLLGIHERARLLGGRVEIESSPGCGTSVFVIVPTTPPTRRETT